MARAASLPLRPSLANQLRDYADLHPSRHSLLTAAAASLLCSFGLLAMASWITVGAPGGHPLHLGHAALLVVILVYVRWDFALTCFVAPLLALSFPFAAIAPRALVVALAGVGVGLQLAPLLLRAPRQTVAKTLLHALTGPLFFAAFLLGLWPTRKATLAL